VTRRIIAWAPSLVVLIAGFTAWIGAFTDRDAFAIRALSIAVVIGLVATAPSWLLARNALGYLAALAVKLAIFFALAPEGLKTIGASYAELRYTRAWLSYFWVAPPALLAVTLIESWLIALRFAGRSLGDTWLWKRRRALGALAGTLALVLSFWWFGRARYYLFRIEHGHAPARYSLAQVGPRALPSIYRELDRLGTIGAGSYRADLVSVIKDIRHDAVAELIRSPLVWEVEAALVEPEPAMVDAVSNALVGEPDASELEKMCIWASDLDFNTKIEIFCRAIEKLPPERQGELVSLVTSSAKYATGDYDPARPRERGDTTYPFRDMSRSELVLTQTHMREKLACVGPRLVSALETGIGSWPPEETPLWALQAVEVLGRLRPLPAELYRRLESVLLRSEDGHFSGRLFEWLAPELGHREPGGTRAVVKRLYGRFTKDSARTAVRLWVADKGRSHGAGPDAFFCDAFASSPEPEKTLLLTLITGSVTPDTCVATTLMSAYEKQLLTASGSPRLLLTMLGLELGRLKADPRISEWARGLLPRVQERDRYRIESLL
jgi:hypothetical protein